MADAHDSDGQVGVLNRIEDTIVALTHAIQLIPGELLRTKGSWIARESLNSCGYAATVAFWKSLEFLHGRGLDQ